ncbi:MAG: shikimate kinase [Ignavibacteriaceae bacterium]|nr:shikimate kinase [Ignavibacteriaceae bacterium]
MKNQIIYLAGFMGAGKSTIGPILANTIGWNFFDLDQLIEKKHNKKVRDIFEQEGESSFRKYESETLLELSNQNNLVVALGGGTMASDDNLKVLKKTGTTIYLKANTESFYKRLRYKRDRPNLGVNESDDFSKEKLTNRIDQLLAKRSQYYEQADIVIETDNYSVGKTVDKIVKLLGKMNIGVKK